MRRLVKTKGGQGLPHKAIRRGFEKRAQMLPQPPFSIETTELEVDSVPCTRYRTERRQRGTIVYFHGGGYVVGSPRTHRNLIAYLARATEAEVWAVDYRLAPEHPFPAAREDALSVMRRLMETQPGPMAMGGDSAGGGLTISTLVGMRDEGIPLPAAAFAYSPWTDLSLSGDSVRLNAVRDALIHTEELKRFAGFYVGAADPTDPGISPLFAELSGLPPILIQASNTEILRDDALRMQDRLQRAGVEVTCEIWPRMSHVWHYLVGRVPEAKKALIRTAGFLHRQWADQATNN